MDLLQGKASRWRRTVSIGFSCLTSCVVSEGAYAATDVSMAVIAIGRLYVVGTTDEPRSPVTLDKQFHTTSDESGKFSFEEIYHPASCIVSVDIGLTTYRAVVSNCAQQMPIGPLPFATIPPPVTGGSPRPPAQIAHKPASYKVLMPAKVPPLPAKVPPSRDATARPPVLPQRPKTAAAQPNQPRRAAPARVEVKRVPGRSESTTQNGAD